MSSSTALTSASASFGGTKRTPGTRGANASASRLPGRRKGTERPPVEASLERDDTRLARRLACVLERRLDRLRARVAEERLCTSEAVGKPLRELLGRLGAVEIRGVPEALELITCGGERRRVAVPERDDRDAGSEVEILATVSVPDTRPLSPHDRHIGASVGGRSRPRPGDNVPLAGSRDDRRLADLGTNPEPCSAHRGEQLRDDSAFERARAEQRVGIVRVQPTDHGALEVDAWHVGDEHDAIGPEPGRQRSGGLVGVDVQRTDGDGSHDGDAVLLECLLHRPQTTREGLADEAELGQPPRAADLVPDEVEGRRAECGGQLGPDGDQRRAHKGEGRRICEATARYEDSRDPPLVQLSGDLGPAP